MSVFGGLWEPVILCLNDVWNIAGTAGEGAESCCILSINPARPFGVDGRLIQNVHDGLLHWFKFDSVAGIAM